MADLQQQIAALCPQAQFDTVDGLLQVMPWQLPGELAPMLAGKARGSGLALKRAKVQSLHVLNLKNVGS